MAALPYMRLYCADYDADTAHLSALQDGIYFRLIRNYWQRGGPLPGDDVRLARIAGVNMREWKRNRDAIREFFTVQENLWHHSRLEHELSCVATKSLNNKRTGNANAKRTQRDGDANGTRSSIYTDTDTEKKVPLGKEPNGDSDTEFWDAAKAFLAPERKNPGSLIGKWIRDHGKQNVANAITRAQLDRAIERIPFIEGCFRKAQEYDPDRITV